MTFTFITSLNLFIIYLLKMKILFAKRIREFTTLQSLVGNMTVNDTNRVLFSSLGTEFWCLLQLDLNFIYQNDLTSYYQLSCMLIFKTLVWWNAVSQSGGNWQVFVDQSHLTHGQPQLNDLGQHIVVKSCYIHCDNEELSDKHMRATEKSEKKYKKYLQKLHGNKPQEFLKLWSQ